jgi:hypothetical protein
MHQLRSFDCDMHRADLPPSVAACRDWLSGGPEGEESTTETIRQVLNLTWLDRPTWLWGVWNGGLAHAARVTGCPVAHNAARHELVKLVDWALSTEGQPNVDMVLKDAGELARFACAAPLLGARTPLRETLGLIELAEQG